MSVVVDTSALVALIWREPGADRVQNCLLAHTERLISAANRVEFGTVIAGRHTQSAEAGLKGAEDFLDALGMRVEAVSVPQSRLALDARIRFGRGFGASAGLNFGDCFAYALARERQAPLLFVGDDFRHTDVAAAIETGET